MKKTTIADGQMTQPLTYLTFYLMLAITVIWSGCSGNGNSVDDGKVSTQTNAVGETSENFIEGTNTAKASDPGGAIEIIFSVDDSGFNGPESTPAGWTRILLNNKGTQAHHMGLIRLLENKTLDDLKKIIDENPRNNLPVWALQSGGPGDISPNETAAVTQNLKHGEYALVNYELGDDEISRPSTKMLTRLTVTNSADTRTEPTADVILTITDFSYNIRNTRDLFGLASGKTIDGGNRILKVINNGHHVHEARIAEIKDGKQAKDFPALYEARSGTGGTTIYTDVQMPFPLLKEDGTGPAGPPPSKHIGGVMGIQPGDTVYLAVNFKQAFYFVYNLLEDQELGTSYLMRPMLLEFPVR